MASSIPTIDLVLRGTKGSPVTWNEIDSNFTNLANAIIQCSTPPLPTTGLFYGGFGGTQLNTLTLINKNAVLIQPESNIGTARSGFAGASASTNALFYCGNDNTQDTNTLTIVDIIGTLIQSESHIGTIRGYLAGANLGSNAMFYGGWGQISRAWNYFNLLTILNSTGVLIGSEINVGTAREDLTGTNIGLNVLYYGGWYTDGVNDIPSNTVTILTGTGTLALAESSVAVARDYPVATTIDGNVLIYSGYINSELNDLFWISPTGTPIGIEANIGTARSDAVGASINNQGLYYSGSVPGSFTNIVTIIDGNSTLVLVEAMVGTARSDASAASL